MAELMVPFLTLIITPPSFSSGTTRLEDKPCGEIDTTSSDIDNHSA